jgi:formate hydrogenlyase subunit 3/multisubunit Na+/H+ antiporter MnhD subunit
MMSASEAMAGLILGPLMAAALAFGFPRWGRWLALGTAGWVSAAGIRLLALTGIEEIQVHRVGGWGAPLGIDLRADGLAVLMLLITAVVGVAVTLYALRYFEPHTPAPAHGTPTSSGAASRPGPGAADRYRTTTMRERYFWPLFLFLWCAQNALFLSADIFNLYVTLELLGLSAVSLVALAGQRAALTAAMRYLLVSLAASLFYLMGVGPGLRRVWHGGFAFAGCNGPIRSGRLGGPGPVERRTGDEGGLVPHAFLAATGACQRTSTGKRAAVGFGGEGRDLHPVTPVVRGVHRNC